MTSWRFASTRCLVVPNLRTSPATSEFKNRQGSSILMSTQARSPRLAQGRYPHHHRLYGSLRNLWCTFHQYSWILIANVSRTAPAETWVAMSVWCTRKWTPLNTHDYSHIQSWCHRQRRRSDYSRTLSKPSLRRGDHPEERWSRPVSQILKSPEYSWVLTE